MRRCPVRSRAIALVFALSSGAANDATAQQLPEWRVALEPDVVIGTDVSIDGDGDGNELFRAVSALRLDDGRIAVLNAGTHELRFFDGGGVLLATAGRQGGGPGELEQPARIYRAGGDTIAIYDARLARRTFFDSAGNLVRVDPPARRENDPFQADSWLYGRNWIDALGTDVDRNRIDAAVAHLPAVDDGSYRRVLIARNGLLWTRVQPAPSERWTVYLPDGRAVAHAILPPHFEPYEIGFDYVLGRVRTGGDVERIVLHRLFAAPLTTIEYPPASEPATAVPPRVQGDLFGALRAMTSLQEIHYANNGSYATSIDDLDVRMPRDAHITIAYGSTDGWLGLGSIDGEAVLCGLAMGWVPAPGWPAGRAFCGKPLP